MLVNGTVSASHCRAPLAWFSEEQHRQARPYPSASARSLRDHSRGQDAHPPIGRRERRMRLLEALLARRSTDREWRRPSSPGTRPSPQNALTYTLSRALLHALLGCRLADYPGVPHLLLHPGSRAAQFLRWADLRLCRVLPPFAVLLLRGYFETSRRRAAAWSMSTPSWPHAAIAILPALVLFVFVQRWLVGGLTAGSVKT